MQGGNSEAIYVIEWEDDGQGSSGVVIDGTQYGTHLFKDPSSKDKKLVSCKHCLKQFENVDTRSIVLHMNRIHPQVRRDMTYEEYMRLFKPSLMKHAHGIEKNMEKSFAIDLRKYVLCPENYQEVLYYDETATIIYDKFPKSEVHLLVLPRNYRVSNSHPTLISSETKVKLEWHIEWVKQFIWKQFTKRYKITQTDLSKERFLQEFIQYGVHSVPSMANTHIHMMTRDFHSERLKNKKHFNSFNSPFFIHWDKLPMTKDLSDKEINDRYIKNYDMICPYCSYNFKNQFSKLKVHLAEEFFKSFVTNVEK